MKVNPATSKLRHECTPQSIARALVIDFITKLKEYQHSGSADSRTYQNTCRSIASHVRKADPTLSHREETLAVLSDIALAILKYIPEQFQSKCWGAIHKGFVGDSGARGIAGLRAEIVEEVELNLCDFGYKDTKGCEFRKIIYRAPRFKDPLDKERFEEIGRQIGQYISRDDEAIQHLSVLCFNMMKVRKSLINAIAKAKNVNPENYREQLEADYIEKTLPKLLEHVGRYLISEDESRASEAGQILRRLNKLCFLHEKAISRILAGRTQNDPGNIKQKDIILHTKHDLINKATETGTLEDITNPELIATYMSLVSRGPYIANVLIACILRDEVKLRHILESSEEVKSKSDLRTELFSLLYESESPDRAMRTFALVELARLGLRYLDETTDASDHLVDVQRQMSNLSEIIFETAYDINYNALREEFGKPTGRAGYILGGANARSEFPSFDHDAFLVFEIDTPENRSFYTRLAERIEKTLEFVGHLYDRGYSPHTHSTPPQILLACTLDDYNELLRSLPDVYNELRTRTGMRWGAGDQDFVEECINEINHRIQLNKDNIIKSHFKDFDALVSKESERSQETAIAECCDIKMAFGGLRDFARIGWVLSVVENDSKYRSVKESKLFLQRQFSLSHDSDKALEAYEFLLDIRIRLDLHYGRNDKRLPLEGELIAFAKALGYEHTPEQPASAALMEELLEKMEYVRGYSKEVFKVLERYIVTRLGFDPQDFQNIQIIERRMKEAEEAEKQRRIDEAAASRQNMIEQRAGEMSTRGRDPFLARLWVQQTVDE